MTDEQPKAMTDEQPKAEEPKLKKIALQGLGRVGSVIAVFLKNPAPLRYELVAKDVLDDDDLTGAFAVINAAPYFTSVPLATKAVLAGAHYLDMTEDVGVTRELRDLAETLSITSEAARDVAIIPQCGLAPGVVSIIAGHMARKFEKLDTIKMRVGALPRHPTNMLGYAQTWNLDGLINQYHEWANVIRDGKATMVPPLMDVEELTVEGDRYEAFTTAGGVGTLCESFPKARTINYKTIRYPGHVKLIRFLIEDMALSRDELKNALARALPIIDQDIVVISVSATGIGGGLHRQITYSKLVQGVPGRSALQTTTASSICAVLDLLADGTIEQRGFVRQEDIPLDKFVTNRFGRGFA